MPKLNDTHLPDRLREAIKQLEAGVEVEAKKNKTLLNAKQQKALEDAWLIQQALRKQHKPPKTEEEKKKIGWKDKREVRIEIYKQALAELESNMVNAIKNLQKQREAKANRVFMDEWSKSLGEGKDRWSAISAGNIAVTRAGFKPSTVRVSKRDKEVNDLEEQLRKSFEAEMTDEEREQRELLKEHEKGTQKRKKV
jgi:hypothetical protein